MEIDATEWVPVWHLIKTLDLRQREIMPMLASIGISTKADPSDGQWYFSREEFRDVLLEVAEDSA